MHSIPSKLIIFAGSYGYSGRRLPKETKLLSDMMYSMTGYGSAAAFYDDKEIKVEVKTLNSKFLDIRLKLPALYKEYEMSLRKIIQREALRGKVDFSIEYLSSSDSEIYRLNTDALDAYVQQIESYAEKQQMGMDNMLSTLLQLPNVVVPDLPALPEEEWTLVQRLTAEAMDNLQAFRREEGRATEGVLREAIARINRGVEAIQPYEAERMELIQNKILQNLNSDFSPEQLDQNRFEQELIYYLEKLDFSEEQERLLQHTAYFVETLESPVLIKGKKLGFISQEMGREINTLGSKAQHSDIQRIVVEMKDDLEKIKEQLFNII